jgi:hypothetical protein
LPSSKPVSISAQFNDWEELKRQLNYALSDVYHLLDYALGYDNKGVMIKMVNGGLGKDVSGFSGLVQITGGTANEITVGTGLQIASSILKIKPQAAEANLTADAAAVSALDTGTGTDHINKAAFDTALGTLVTEVNALKDEINGTITKLNNVLAKLRLAEVLNT